MTGLNAKLMHQKLKIGWTTSNFVQHFNTNEKEFLEAIQKEFDSDDARSMISDLRRNDKRYNRHVGKTQKKKKITKGKSSKIKDEECEMSEVVVETKEMQEELTMKDVLEQLQEEEGEIRENIYDQEVAKSALISRKAELYQILKNEKAEMLILKEKIQQHKERVSDTISKLNLISEEMTRLGQEISENHLRLKEVEKQIKSLKKVYIFVYDTGKIEAENFNMDIMQPWNDSCNEKFSEILEEEAVQVLRVNQTRQLAKILVLAQYLKEQDLEFEITFDSQAQQQAYEKLS